jgi:hypothetical protein
MTLATDLAAATAQVNVDAALLRAVVQGPAGGAASLVTFPNGSVVKTLARASSEVAGPFVLKAGDTMTGLLHLRDTSDGQLLFETAAGAFKAGIGTSGLLAGAADDLRIRSDGAAIRIGFTGDEYAKIARSEGLYLRSTGTSGQLLLTNTAGVFVAGLGTNSLLGSAGTDALRIRSDASAPIEFGFSGASAWQLYTSYFRPVADNSSSLGDASHRLSVLYAGTGTISTSDGRQKLWRSYLRDTPGLVNVGLMIPEILGSFQFLQSIEEKGRAAWEALTPEERAGKPMAETINFLGKERARIHVGLTVQELVALFDVVRQQHPDLPTPAQLGLYGRDAVKTRVPQTVTRQRPLMIDEPYTDLEYEDRGAHLVCREVSRTRRVAAPPTLKPVLNADGTQRLEQRGFKPSGLVDPAGAPGMVPNMVPMMRPVPVMEPYEDTIYDEVDLGEYVLSTRSDQIAYLCIGAAHIARKELEARVAVLEAAAP